MDTELWKQAEQIFLHCADMPGVDRAAYLDEACKNDAALRRTVEGLLYGDSRSDDSERLISETAGEIVRERRDHWLGKSFGAYTIESRIAEGGMGVVYLANRSDRQFEQQVAIKLLTGSGVSSHLLERFLAERQILANLNHPNIAHLLDGGETPDGIPYLAMEYIDGVPITDYCDRNKLNVEQRIRLFKNVCAAVQYAHANMVIHRDIKPSNVLVGTDGVPKLLDFGIAKLLDQDASPSGGDHTVQGMQMMSPHYASPEQILGERVTTASDVYGLGLLLHQLLSGGFPYDFEQADRASVLESIITSSTPSPPSQQVQQAAGRAEIAAARGTSPRELERTLRGDLDTIVLKALRKEPERRYATPQGLINDLQHYLGHQPILARPPTVPYLMARFWQRHKVAAIGVLATLVAVIGGTTAATVGFLEARQSEREAVSQANTAESVSKFLISLFQEANPNNSAGNERSVRELLDIGTIRTDTDLKETPLVQARMLETLSGVYKSLADYPKARQLLLRAISLHEENAPQDYVERSRMLADLGDLSRLLSDFEQAERQIEQALTLHRQSAAGPSQELADAMNGLSLVYEETGRYEDAGAMMEETLRLRQGLYQAPNADIAVSLHNLAWYYNRRGRYTEAESYARQALTMRVQLFGEIHPRVAASLSMLSRIYFSQGDWDAAEQEAQRGVLIAEQIYDDGHPDLSFPMYELAKVKYARGDLQQAAALFGKIVDWERVSLGADSHDLGMSIKAYATTLVDLARYEEAERLLNEAWTIFEPLPVAANRARFHTSTVLGLIMIRTGRLAEAGELLADKSPDLYGEGISARLIAERSLARAELLLAKEQYGASEKLVNDMLDATGTTLSKTGEFRAKLQYVKALALLRSGKTGQATEWLNRSILEFDNFRGEGYWGAALVKAELAEVYLSMGQEDEARTLLESVIPELRNSLGSSHPQVARRAEQLSLLNSAQN